ncbi:FAD-linked oxidase [Candidatus Poribacteria bacterium]|nr:MAG: FAD-linked oxidase [Candidatus Poribacteria bacterium]
MSISHNLSDAIKAWTEVLNSENVITDEQALISAQTATFATTQSVSAIIKPSTREEVQDCVVIANKYQVPLYPISTGKNWGFGSRVPPIDGGVIISLDRLNRILDFNEKLAYITIEPGVTYNQVYKFLQENKSNLTSTCPGSTPDASLIGNALERGYAGALNGEKWSQVCGLEVVLPSGKCIHTGLERFPMAKASKVFSWGVGPSLDGLFSQSNLGIVTKLTLWLTPLPKFCEYLSFSINDARKLSRLVDKLQLLKRDAVIDTACGLYNCYKVLTTFQQYPWDKTEGKIPLSEELLQELLEPFQGAVWFGGTIVVAPNDEIGRMKRQLVHQMLSDSVDLITFETSNSENPLIEASLHTELASVYWRKSFLPPDQMDPDRDKCGAIWCSLVVPFIGAAVDDSLKIVTETMAFFNFEPIISILCPSIRVVYIIASIIYDRQRQGQDKAAMTCHNLMIQRLTSEGFIPHRLGIQAMNALPDSIDDYVNLLKDLKNTMDPADILAPGRYDFRHEWTE